MTYNVFSGTLNLAQLNCPPVRLSVWLPHSWSTPKRFNVSKCLLHCTIKRCQMHALSAIAELLLSFRQHIPSFRGCCRLGTKLPPSLPTNYVSSKFQVLLSVHAAGMKSLQRRLHGTPLTDPRHPMVSTVSHRRRYSVIRQCFFSRRTQHAAIIACPSLMTFLLADNAKLL